MAYTLKTTGIATNLVMCVAVDEDGTTIKEFVSSDVQSFRTLDTGVAASVTTGSWKSTARKYWSSTDNSGVPAGVKFAAGHRPSLPLTNANGVAYFIAFHSSSGKSGDGGYISHSTVSDGGQAGMTTGNAVTACLAYSAGLKGAGGNTTVPTGGATKFSLGVSYKDSGSPSDRYFYGLESGSLATDGTSDTHGGAISSTTYVYGLGGFDGFGAIACSRYIDCLFNKELSTVEMQSLHDDWFNTLFNAADATAPVLTLPTGVTTGSTTATIGATTDEGNGTLYGVATILTTTPTSTQVEAGQDSTGTTATYAGSAAVSSTGAKTLSATGLTAGLLYYSHVMHKDAAGNKSNVVTSAINTRTASDVTTVGWTSTAGTLAEVLDETVANDADFITSPTLGTGSPAILATSSTLTAGTYNIRVRGKYTTGSGQVRINMLNASNVSQGVSGWQVLTATETTYTLSVTITGSATRVQIEVQA